MSSLIKNKESLSELTLEEKQAEFKEQLSYQVTKLFNNISAGYTRIISSVVSGNSLGLTPKEVVEGLGADAAELLKLGEILKGAILAAKPDADVPEIPSVEELLKETEIEEPGK